MHVFLVIVVFNIIALTGPPLHATRLYPVEEIQNEHSLYATNARVYGRLPHLFEFKTDSRKFRMNLPQEIQNATPQDAENPCIYRPPLHLFEFKIPF